LHEKCGFLIFQGRGDAPQSWSQAQTWISIRVPYKPKSVQYKITLNYQRWNTGRKKKLLKINLDIGIFVPILISRSWFGTRGTKAPLTRVIRTPLHIRKYLEIFRSLLYCKYLKFFWIEICWSSSLTDALYEFQILIHHIFKRLPKTFATYGSCATTGTNVLLSWFENFCLEEAPV